MSRFFLSARLGARSCCLLCNEVLTWEGMTVGEVELAINEHYAWEHQNPFARSKLNLMGVAA